MEKTNNVNHVFGATDEAKSESSSSSHNIELGKRGEDAAAAYLSQRGYNVLARNWRCPAGEADIVAADENGLHFIEVKTRMSERRGFPAEAVDEKKRQKYERMAEIYLCDCGIDEDECDVYFDIISILVGDNNRAFLRFHKNAFGRECEH